MSDFESNLYGGKQNKLVIIDVPQTKKNCNDDWSVLYGSVVADNIVRTYTILIHQSITSPSSRSVDFI